MGEFAIFTYGLLTTFVLSGATRNQKLRRPNPKMLEYCGYVLCGASAAMAAALLWVAARPFIG